MADDQTPDQTHDQIPGQLPLFDLPPSEPPGYDEPVGPDTEAHRLDDFSDEMLRGRLDKLTADNRGRWQRLMAAGMVPEPQRIMIMRLDTLLDLILTPSQRLQFDVLFETRMAAFLDMCLSQRARASLLTPGAGPAAPPGPGLFVPR